MGGYCRYYGQYWNESIPTWRTVSYFAEPLLKIFGDVAKLPGKVGRFLIQMDIGADGNVNHGDAEYATWDRPWSIKLELETYFDLIYSMTSTRTCHFVTPKESERYPECHWLMFSMRLLPGKKMEYSIRHWDVSYPLLRPEWEDTQPLNLKAISLLTVLTCHLLRYYHKILKSLWKQSIPLRQLAPSYHKNLDFYFTLTQDANEEITA